MMSADPKGRTWRLILDYTGPVTIRPASRGADLDDYESPFGDGETGSAYPIERALSHALSKALGHGHDQGYDYTGWSGRLRIRVGLLTEEGADGGTGEDG